VRTGLFVLGCLLMVSAAFAGPGHQTVISSRIKNP